MENDIGSLFSSLPCEDDDSYTIVLRNIVLHNNLIAKEQEVESYLQNNTSANKFAIFYSLLIICREYNNYSKYNYYVDKYANQFANIKLYKIIQSTYFRNKAILGEPDEFRRAIKYAEEACEALPTNLAVKHHYAAILVLALEENIVVDTKNINKAIERLDDVIVAFPKHALYYSTKGRLLASAGDYHQGILNMKKALDLENGLDKDSMIRIGEYNFYLLRIKMMVENDQIDNRIRKINTTFVDMENNLDSVKTQYLEYLAFFSSVLAFILTTVNIVSKVDDFNKCVGIIIMFAGALIFAFSAFRMLLYFSSKIKFGFIKIIVCYLIGLFLMAVGFLIGNQILLQYILNILKLI